MALSKFDNLWRLVSNHKLEIAGIVPDGVICSLCMKLLTDPYVSACGCQFCGCCIRSYLCSDQRKCNGNKPECNEDLLELNKTVVPDYRTRHNLGNVMVKCPYEPCTFVSELMRIENHILLCKMMPQKCPYDTVGCVDKIAFGTSLEDHVTANAVLHSQLILKANTLLRNEIDRLKEVVEVSVEEISKLKEDKQSRKRTIEEIVNESQRKEMEIMHDVAAVKRCMFECIDKAKMDSNNSTDSIKHDIKKIQINFENEMEKKQCLKTAFAEMEARVKHNEANIDLLKDDLYRTTSRHLAKNVVHDFVWTINRFSTVQGWQQSKPFYKDDYKLNLSICIGSKHLYLSLNSMKGDKDDELCWPMPHTVTLSIVDQCTMTVYKSDTYKYDAGVQRESMPSVVATSASLFSKSLNRKNVKKIKNPFPLTNFGLPNSTSLFGSQNNIPTFNTTNNTPRFDPQNNAFIFGTTNSDPLFCSQNNNSVFDTTNGASRVDSQNNTPLFSAPNNTSSFGSPNNTSSFGAPNNTSSFGAPNNTSIFGAPNNTSSFGAPNNTSSFGASNNTSSFGAPNNTLSFGAPKTAFSFGAPKTTSSFGAPNNTSSLSAPNNTFSFDVRNDILPGTAASFRYFGIPNRTASNDSSNITQLNATTSLSAPNRTSMFDIGNEHAPSTFRASSDPTDGQHVSNSESYSPPPYNTIGNYIGGPFPSSVPTASSTHYNIWCLWMSMEDVKDIPGLLVNDSLMVCCYLDKKQ